MGKKISIALVIIIFVVGIGGYYYYLNNSAPKEEKVQVSAVSNVLLKNMDKNYPPTPKEVIKYYSEIMKVLYNESYTEEDLEKLADRMLLLYDEDLAANNPRDSYIIALKGDVAEYARNGYKIVNANISSSTDVEFGKVEGREVAKLYCYYSIQAGAEYKTSAVIYELRKEKSSGHWKILGFKTLTEEDK